MRVVLSSVQPKGVPSVAGAQVYAYQSHICSKGALMKAFSSVFKPGELPKYNLYTNNCADVVKSMFEQGGLKQLPKYGLSTPGALAEQLGGVKGLGGITVKADTPSLSDSPGIQGVGVPAGSSPAQVKYE